MAEYFISPVLILNSVNVEFSSLCYLARLFTSPLPLSQSLLTASHFSSLPSFLPIRFLAQNYFGLWTFWNLQCFIYLIQNCGSFFRMNNFIQSEKFQCLDCSLTLDSGFHSHDSLMIHWFWKWEICCEWKIHQFYPQKL